MKLLRKSAAKAAASRANGAKSTGPVASRGKSIARLNAIKHWGRAEAIRDLLPALGEDPAEFENVRRDLYESLEPCDGFERMLVNDMVDLHWHLRRMLRGQTANEALHRREEKAQEEARAAAVEHGKLHELEPFIAAKLGFVGLNDSPAKFYRVIESLKAIGQMVQLGGFTAESVAFLQSLYGC